MDSKSNINSSRRALLWAGEKLSSLSLGLAAIALLSVVVLNAINILLRYFFFFSVSWAQEAMLYLTIFGVYVGAISVAWQQWHIRIDALLSLAPPEWLRLLDIFITFVLAAILIPVVFASYRVAIGRCPWRVHGSQTASPALAARTRRSKWRGNSLPSGYAGSSPASRRVSVGV
jgi:TRAP-type C4-dicarboxylate transport system permease small subunit